MIAGAGGATGWLRGSFDAVAAQAVQNRTRYAVM
jgi:hypothetical protein